MTDPAEPSGPTRLRVPAYAVDLPRADAAGGHAPRNTAKRTALGAAGRSQIGRSYDRVGRSRLTPLGGVMLFTSVLILGTRPEASDRTVLGVLWVAVIGLFVIGIVWPLIAVRFVKVTALSPRDATVGDHVLLDVTVTGRSMGCEIRSLDPTGEWRSTGAPGSGQLPHLADRRGVFHLVRIEVRVTGALGVLAAHRVHNIALPIGVEVAPKPIDVRWLPAAAPLEGATDPVMAGTPGVEVVRSVRPYAPGDPARHVHWPTSARMGSLVVREMEPPAPYGQAIVIDLRNLGVDTERAAGYGLGAALAVLADGGRLVLCTAEPGGPVTGVVRFPIDARRRLARAVPGEPGEPPPGWPVVEIGA